MQNDPFLFRDIQLQKVIFFLIRIALVLMQPMAKIIGRLVAM